MEWRHPSLHVIVHSDPGLCLGKFANFCAKQGVRRLNASAGSAASPDVVPALWRRTSSDAQSLQVKGKVPLRSPRRPSCTHALRNGLAGLYQLLGDEVLAGMP